MGIKGNEIADKIAEKGRLNGLPYNKVPTNDAIKWFKERTVWANEYNWRKSSTSLFRQSKPTTTVERQEEHKRAKDSHESKNRTHLALTWIPPTQGTSTKMQLLQLIVQKCLTKPIMQAYPYT